ncbi:MAG: ABC transporter ATP-binding protein [Candidatus Micrarchaeota archaeon]|nr:ABC transporter ATP-binding protein [Candidatus Micrarchaeota archaeon]
MRSDISVKSAVKSFGKTVALSRVDFSSAKGMNMILGPNGAGKSTLLRCIDGLYHVDSGSVTVLGENPYKNTRMKDKISLLTDNYALYDFMTVRDNLKFFGRLYGLGGGETISIAKDVLARLDATEYIDRKVAELSRGTKQKVAFCRAVLNDPDILLLDEPTAFLDAHSAEAMRRILLDCEKRGKTILLVTQKLDEVTRFNAKIAIIRKGKMVKETSTEGLYSLVLKKVNVDFRLARPLALKQARRIRGFYRANSDNATLISFRVSNYKDINRILKSLMGFGAIIASVDYVEHLIDDLSA